ncbi:hypothetical protein V8C35DRAFT_323845 [Trichoderma chlorosporum]
MKTAWLSLPWFYALVVEAVQDCKVTPKSPRWPSPSDWEQLNRTISGKLLNLLPPSSVCHHNEPNFNPSQCVVVSTQWNSSVFYADDPLSVDWPNFNNDSCLLDLDAPCNKDGFPAFVVNATRCSLPLGLSSATIAAGMQMGEIYAAVAQHVVRGDVLTVGIIGLLTGGGYGPLSSTYGLAADAALEFDIVTADGKLLTGSAGTFGVVTSVTLRTFPNLSITSHLTEDYLVNISFCQTVAPLQGPGFWDLKRPVSNSVPGRGIISWALNIMNQPVAAANRLVEPPLQRLKNSTWSSQISIETETQEFQDFSSYADVFDGLQVVGVDGLIGGRFLDKKTLSSNKVDIKEAIKATITPAGGIILGEMLMGKGVWDAQPRGGDNAVSKAWRSAITNTYRRSWLRLSLLNKNKAALRRLAPHTGVYLNECDPMEPNFQDSFWGDKYGKLLQIKQTYDPQGVFFCHPCVGSEFCIMRPDGQLCKI